MDPARRLPLPLPINQLLEARLGSLNDLEVFDIPPCLLAVELVLPLPVTCGQIALIVTET